MYVCQECIDENGLDRRDSRPFSIYETASASCEIHGLVKDDWSSRGPLYWVRGIIRPFNAEERAIARHDLYFYRTRKTEKFADNSLVVAEPDGLRVWVSCKAERYCDRLFFIDKPEFLLYTMQPGKATMQRCSVVPMKCKSKEINDRGDVLGEIAPRWPSSTLVLVHRVDWKAVPGDPHFTEYDNNGCDMANITNGDWIGDPRPIMKLALFSLPDFRRVS